MSKKASKKKEASASAAAGVRLNAHPRAQASIRRVRGWGGLAGLVAVTVLSSRAGLPLPDALLRGLAGGIAAHFGAWLCAVLLWRQIALGELETAREAYEQRVAEARRRAADAAAARLAADAAQRRATA